MQSFSAFNPTRIQFGAGSRSHVIDHLPAEIERVAVVTDAQVRQSSPCVAAVIQQLEQRFDTLVFDAVEPNPSFQTIGMGIHKVRTHRSEWVFGIGGGSSLDAAKGMALGAVNPDPIETYVHGALPPNPALPLTCLPTTAGTGSEVTPFAVFSDPKQQSKFGLAHDSIFPRMAIVDPELTYSMPRGMVVSSGLDVLSHAVEAFLSTLNNPHNDLYAVSAIRVVLNALPGAVNADRDAQQSMAWASTLAGLAITHASTILPHIMGYPLTVYHGLPHGLASFLSLPAFLDHLVEHQCASERLELLRGIVGDLDAFRRLARDLDVNLSLKSYGVQEKQLPEFVEKTIHKGDVSITPGPVSSSDILAIYKKSL